MAAAVDLTRGLSVLLSFFLIQLVFYGAGALRMTFVGFAGVALAQLMRLRAQQTVPPNPT
jgi:hypothetical protein